MCRWKLSQLSKLKENQNLHEKTFHDITEKQYSLLTEEQKEKYVYLAENFNHTSHEPKIFFEQNPTSNEAKAFMDKFENYIMMAQRQDAARVIIIYQ